jgi:protocatechuate 3,4-dioxygenase beta subunit
VILLPEQSADWPDATRRLVLLHELAHIKRRDVGFQLLGRLATAIYWFHPLAWYAAHRLRAECESACDDHVVHTGVPRTDYAQQLVDLARDLRPTAFVIALPLTRPSKLENRITALLDDNRNHQPLARRVSALLSLSGLCLLATLALVHLDRPASGQPAAARPAAFKPAAAPKRFDSFNHEVYTHPITVTGQALDPDGKPLPGAHIYIASRLVDYKRIAETTTDDQGRYQFRDIPLPIRRANSNTKRDEAAFEVFGEADGLGFDWHQQVWLYPTSEPANMAGQPQTPNQRSSGVVNDNFILNFNFPPAAQISGTILDEQGNPRPNVRLEIRECQSLKFIHNVFGVSFSSLNERDIVPASIKVRLTDHRGRFQFTGLPPDCRFRIDVRGDNIPSQRFSAATADHVEQNPDDAPVLTGEIRYVCATPVAVPIKMLLGGTKAPASRVAVQAGSGSIGILETTDDQGLVTLKLPPGKYYMENWPARGTPYLVTKGELTVTTKSPLEPLTYSLDPAAIVEITVIDATTGAPVPNVDVWHQPNPDAPRERLVFRSWEVATRIAWRESPRSDAQGKLRVLVEPGTHRIGVGRESLPTFSAVVETDGQDVECLPGKPVHLTFHVQDIRNKSK